MQLVLNRNALYYAPIVAQAAKTPVLKFHPAAWLYLLILLLLLYVVLPQLSSFHRSLPLLAKVSGPWVLAAILCSLCATIAAGFKYGALALKPVRPFATVMVQFASLLVNRLLPAGIGGIGMNYAFLYKARHSKLEAAVVVSMNNLLGLVGHLLVVCCLLVLSPASSRFVSLKINAAVLLAAVTITILLAVAVVFSHDKLAAWLAQLRKSLRRYRSHPAKLLAGLLWSAAIAVSYGLCLWASAQALHTPISFVAALVVLTFGVAAATVTPTPGGLVGAEAALAAGLVAYGLGAAEALAVTLLYRFITYWFALLLGALAFIWVRRASYV